MNAVPELLARLAALDVRLTLDGDRLNVSAPRGTLDQVLRDELGRHKDAIKAHLRQQRASAPEPVRAVPALGRVPRLSSMPVSHSQQRLWFLRRMDPSSSAYNIGTAMRLRGPFNPTAFERAIDALVARHESLRTRFFAVDGTPRCSIETEAHVRMQVIDLSASPASQVEDDANRELTAIARVPFDLGRSPLVRAALVRLAPDHHLFALIVDHIVADGISLALMAAEVQVLYREQVGGAPAGLPALPLQFIDFVHWQQAAFAAGAMAPHLAFWKRELQGLPSFLALPTDRPRPPLQTQRGARRVELVPEPLRAELKAAARREGVTLYMLMLAAFEILLYRYTGEEDFAVGTVVGGRDRPETERMVGFFANSIVQRASLAGRPTGRDLLRRVRDTALNAYAHQEIPFDMLVEALAPRRALDHSPLFQVLFVLNSAGAGTPRIDGVETSIHELPHDTARFDLALDVIETTDQGMRAYFEYNTDLFDAATIDRMAGHYLTLLAGIAAGPDTPVTELPMLGPAERRALLAHGRGPAALPAPADTIHGLFEAAARAHPGAPAVVMDGRSLSYAELDARANRLAHHLRSLGVGSETRVGVWMERSPDMVVALLGILKAGGAYVPLDPAFPRDRLAFMIDDAGLPVVVTHARVSAELPSGAARVVTLDRDADRIGNWPAEAPSIETGPSTLAYVIYTSGSTGRPKGVQIEHGSVVNFLRSMHHEPGIGASDRLVSVTTLSFDICGLELFGPLTAGGTVVLASRATALDGRALAALLDDEGATILQATPATWQLLLDSGWRGVRSPAGLRMLCGGEALPRALADRLLALPGELWNMYGPTETTIWSTTARVRDTSRPITIGRPIAATTVHVLDAAGNPAPIGVAGELCIGGAGVARGYLNRPELTAEKFVMVAIDGGTPERVYRTGDLVRVRADGQLEFAGRRDTQVKLRGFRIELEEIETVLAQFPGLRRGTVTVREDRPGDQRMVAYVVTDGGTAFDPEAARAHLRTRLPEYMIPNLFVTLDVLPLTPNGKVDRNALPVPETPAAAEASDDTLMSPAEQRTAAAWREVLGLRQVGLHDNFFDLGGHSLLLVKLQAELQRTFGVELPLVDLFQHTTVQAQTARLAGPPVDDAALQRARTRAARLANA